MNTIRFIDLFAGIGGFRYGLQLSKGKFECVWSNEWDKYASSIYGKHYGECDTRDIRTVKSNEIPDFDLLVGGFPCQAFSIAGKRQGFQDTRGTLFFEIARILADKRPRHFILENAKGLLSHDEGKTFQTVLGVLSGLGYEYQWQVLNSKNFGVPQNRERVFIVGNLRGERRPKIFPVAGESGNDTSNKSKTESSRSIAYTLDANYYKGVSPKGYQDSKRQLVQVNNPKHSNNRVYSDEGISPSLNTIQGGLRQPKVIRTPLKFLQRNQKNIEGDYSFTVDGANTGGVRQDMKIRRLTPIECERLQGFPDGWTKWGIEETPLVKKPMFEGGKPILHKATFINLISDTQRYKCLGNAVTTNVITWLGDKLC